jgi:hypothetical protein
MTLRRALLLAAGLLAAAPAPASATLTAERIRIGDHPGFVRVVVDFSGGRVFAGEVVASDPNPFPDGRVRLPIQRTRLRTTATPVSAHGVRVRMRRGSGRTAIRIAAAPRRFKYARVRDLHGPERLVIDLFESAPPRAAAEIRRADDGCLSLTSFDVGARRTVARGREQDLFEHSFVVRLRRANGRLLAQRPGTAPNGRWRLRLRHRRPAAQDGTLEVVALSAKDGTLDCIVQVRVRLGG